MKKLILVAAMALVSVSLSAQVFIGGSLGIGTQGNTDRVANASSSQFTLTLAPNVGFKLNDDMCVGGRLRFGTTSNTNAGVVTPGRVSFGVQPYFRYNLLYFGDFALAGEANTALIFSGQTTTTTTPGAPDSVNKWNSTTFSIGVTPVLLYQLNKHITLEANLNILTLGFVSTSTKDVDIVAGATTTNQDDTQSNFVTAVNANDVFGGGWGAIQIGFTYAF